MALTHGGRNDGGYFTRRTCKLWHNMAAISVGRFCGCVLHSFNNSPLRWEPTKSC